MKLYEYFEFMDENKNCEVIDSDTNQVVSKYDGKDSIDEEYNERNVVRACFIKSTNTYKMFI